MYYNFDDEVSTVDLGSTNSSHLTYGYITLLQLKDAAKHFSLPAQSLVKLTSFKNFNNELYTYDDCCFAIINTGSDCFALYVKKNLLLLVMIEDVTHTVRDSFISLNVSDEITLCTLVCTLFEDLVNSVIVSVNDIQAKTDCMEKQLLKQVISKDFNTRLFLHKEELIKQYSYCDTLLDLLSLLHKNSADIFDEKELTEFEPISERISRLKESIGVMRDGIIHLRDAYQSNLDLRLNQTMKIFTVFTVLFSPLSFISSWYGMNFAYMPELKYRYAYPCIIVLAIVVTVSLLIWFKHKKWI